MLHHNMGHTTVPDARHQEPFLQHEQHAREAIVRAHKQVLLITRVTVQIGPGDRRWLVCSRPWLNSKLGRKWFVEYKKRLHLEDIPKQSVAKTAKKEKEGRNSVGTSAAGYWQCDARLLRFVVPLSRQRLRRRRDTATCALRCSWHRARRTSFKAKARHGMGEKSQRPGAVGAARTWVPFATITS